ncbi:uncharacterized protein LOC112878826 [Panicum hallii]|uniref:uncharacterized protein LOC112878826 n=1 Tax=Panicum hallii TaxID=206008 RepID=UPI000DF4E087|nr:uncharacterized protein LOC112878826 [Panicum hallii]
MLPCCHTSILLHANISRLQSSRFSAQTHAPRNGNRSSSFCDCYHCHGGHRAISWCDPAAGEEYPVTGYAGEEGCHEEVYVVCKRCSTQVETSHSYPSPRTIGPNGVRAQGASPRGRVGGEEQVKAPDAAPTDGTGAQQPASEDAAGTSRSPEDLLMTGPGYQNLIATDLVDDPMLMANNIKTLKQAYKELYDYAMNVITHS